MPRKTREQCERPLHSQRVLGTVMGDTFPNHNSKCYYRNPYILLYRYFGPFGTLENKARAFLGLGLWGLLGLGFRVLRV